MLGYKIVMDYLPHSARRVTQMLMDEEDSPAEATPLLKVNHVFALGLV